MKQEKLASKDVMIGDWILVDKNAWVDDEYDPRCCCTNYQPYLIENGEDIDNVDLGDSPAYGIPITKEIMDKNFESGDGIIYTLYRDEEIGEHVFYNMTRQSVGYRLDKDSPCSELTDVKYVHELQHILKIIKNDKSIEL